MIFIIIILSGILQDASSHWNKNNEGVFIDGYDLVAYFDEGPKRGSEKFTTEYRRVKFYFSSKKNLEIFQLSPEKYIPKYGGYCAYAMGIDGSKVKIDPLTYKIIEGQLYLFYNFWANNTLTTWNKEEEKLKKSADQYWLQLLKM